MGLTDICSFTKAAFRKELWRHVSDLHAHCQSVNIAQWGGMRPHLFQTRLSSSKPNKSRRRTHCAIGLGGHCPLTDVDSAKPKVRHLGGTPPFDSERHFNVEQRTLQRGLSTSF